MAFVTSRTGWVSDFIFVGSFYYDNEDDYNCESALLFAYAKATRAAKELRWMVVGRRTLLLLDMGKCYFIDP